MSNNSKFKSGWIAGAGFEYAINNDCSFKIEYLDF